MFAVFKVINVFMDMSILVCASEYCSNIISSFTLTYKQLKDAKN